MPATARQTMIFGDDGVSMAVLIVISATEPWEGLAPTFKQAEVSFALFP